MSEGKPYPSDVSGHAASLRAGSSWRYLLTLYTVASLIEAMFWGQMGAFTPLYLPRLGIAPQDVAGWTGAIVSSPALSGCPSCPSGARWPTATPASRCSCARLWCTCSPVSSLSWPPTSGFSCWPAPS